MRTGQLVYPEYAAGPTLPVSANMNKFSVRTGDWAMAAAAVLLVGNDDASPIPQIFGNLTCWSVCCVDEL
jgi:hypothetical protein